MQFKAKVKHWEHQQRIGAVAEYMYANVRVGRRGRSFQDDTTASRLLSEVKHLQGQLVLRWGTTLES